MFRLILALFAYCWSLLLETEGGGSGGTGNQGPEKFELTADELTARTNKAAEDKQKEIAKLLGIDVDKIADAKGLIEAGRKAGDSSGGSGGESGSGDGNDDQEGWGAIDGLLDTIEKLNTRLEGIETAEEGRRQQATEQTRQEKLAAALKEAGVRDDKLEQVSRYAGTYDLSLNDKGELDADATKEAVEGAKSAFADAFRGEGDTGSAADASGREQGGGRPKNLADALAAHYGAGA